MQRPNHPKRSAHETFCGNIELILEKYKECLSYPILEPLSSADNMKITEFQLLSVYTEKSNTTFNWVDGTGHILYSNSRGLCLNRDFFGSNELRHKKQLQVAQAFSAISHIKIDVSGTLHIKIACASFWRRKLNGLKKTRRMTRLLCWSLHKHCRWRDIYDSGEMA